MRDPKRQRIRIGGAVHAADWLRASARGQVLLAEARKAGERPCCQCHESGVEMSITRRGNRYYLTRVPGSALQHHPACPSAADIDMTSALNCYAASAIRFDDTEGVARVALDAGVTRARHRVPAIGMDGLLDLLFMYSGLNIYNPDDSSIKHWGEARDMLAAAAGSICLDDGSYLSERLLLPFPFEKASHTDRVNDYCAFMSEGATRLVCAPLRSIEPSTYGWGLEIKHLSGIRFWVASHAYEGARAKAACEALPESSALCLALVRPGRSDGNFNVTALALRHTNERLIPCLTDKERQAAEWLMEHGIGFYSPLRYDAAFSYPLADFVLTSPRTAGGGSEDAGPATLGFIQPVSGTSEIDAARKDGIESLRRAGLPYAYWGDGAWVFEASPS